jgi:hypothetical protein
MTQYGNVRVSVTALLPGPGLSGIPVAGGESAHGERGEDVAGQNPSSRNPSRKEYRGLAVSSLRRRPSICSRRAFLA